jgi:hypothetical protein
MGFIDGDHSYETCRADIDLMLRCLRRPSIVAIHDVIEPNWPEVVKAVREAERALALRKLIRVGCLEVFEVLF